MRRYAGLRRTAAVVLVGLGVAGRAAAQSPVFDPAGSTRAAGLNGAGAALVGDAAAVFSNPAGLATISHIALAGEYQVVAPERRQLMGAFAWRLRQFDFGAGVRYLDGSGEDHDLLGAGTLIYRFGMIAFGGSAKMARRVADGVEERGLSGDLGFALAVFDIMALGFAVQNVGGNWDGQSALAMPRFTRLGFTMNYVDPQETFRLLSTIELQWAEGRGTRTVIGAEGGMVLSNAVGVIGRAAYGARPDGLLQPRFTYGVSVALTRLTVDYAFEPVVDGVSSTQRIGVRLGL